MLRPVGYGPATLPSKAAKNLALSRPGGRFLARMKFSSPGMLHAKREPTENMTISPLSEPYGRYLGLRRLYPIADRAPGLRLRCSKQKGTFQKSPDRSALPSALPS
jgi:hypothetical protein